MKLYKTLMLPIIVFSTILNSYAQQPKVDNTTTGADKIFKTAKVTTKFSPNPIKSEEALNFIIKNGEALKDSLRFDFYNSMGQLTYQYIPRTTEAKIDISSMSSGIYFIVVASKYAKETYTITIQ